MNTHALTERRYRVYSLAMLWQETKDGKRIDNAGSARMMYREAPSEAELKRWSDATWAHYKAKAVDPSEPVITLRALGEETWCLTWFSHYTFDTGQTDAETLASFEDFVDRVQSAHGEEAVLMGAEDRWRWSGAEPGDRCPPCRCDGCKKSGVIRICH